MSQRLVVKFGGTSVGSAQPSARRPTSFATLRAEGHQVAVVTSAMSGVTDALLGGACGHVGHLGQGPTGFAQTAMP